ncbi:MAG: hypothetical protein RI949_2395 [Pseudomonadota bacterium]|jgi:hypothetical protein
MKLIASAALALALALGFTTPPAAASEGCYICKSGSGSGCQQCAYGSKDTPEARKACEKRGCKIGGTKPCATASDTKTCALPASPTMLTAALAR